jgi:hypothetical protein
MVVFALLNCKRPATILLRLNCCPVFANPWSSMNVRRRWRVVTVVLSLLALLFTQSALATYACAGPSKAFQVAQMTEANLPCAEEMSKSMDNEQPSLCHAHCQSAQGTLDHYQPAQLPAISDVGPVLIVAPAAKPVAPGAYLQPSLLRRSASPPLAVAHCCFRI